MRDFFVFSAAREFIFVKYFFSIDVVLKVLFVLLLVCVEFIFDKFLIVF